MKFIKTNISLGEMGASFRARSFIWGVTIASITWIVVLYLYYILNQFQYHTILDGVYQKQKMKSGEVDSYSNIKQSRVRSFNDIVKDVSKGKHDNSVPNENLEKNEIAETDNVKKLSKNYLTDSHNLNKEDMDALLADLGQVKTIADQEVREEGYRLHAFNTLISSRLSMDRPIPDTRNKRCKDLKYPYHLPSASVVVCFYREDIPTLLRTIHTILDRSPVHLLEEIILVDDTAEDNYHLEVEKNIKDIHEKVKLYKTPKREGLIRARVFGSRKAVGEVLVFLDSHVEVNVQWLEPLLSRIYENRTHVVTPIIDVINPDTFKYTPSPLVKGGFNWGLHFKWDNIPFMYFSDKTNYVKPIRSPTMAGGLFAMNRQYFKDLGEYDMGMDIWGGENLEISFRIWMCGGTLEIVPCSRVGHIFRKRRPYGDPDGGNSLLKNSIRVAEVWMDEFKDKFESMLQSKKVPHGDVTERVLLRKKLRCKSFKWYLETIYPKILNGTTDVSDSDGPKKFERWDQRTRNYKNEWKVQLNGTALCIESEEGVSQKGSKLVLSECTSIPRQSFYETDKSELVLGKILCLEASSKMPRLGKCHEMGGNQAWRIPLKHTTTTLYNTATGLCLTATEIRSGSYIDMALCSVPQMTQWNLIPLV